MFKKEECSFGTYRKLLRDIRESGKNCDYTDVLSGHMDKFLILRHDIEFSVDRAARLFELECEEGVASSFFVQITNNAYNPFSEKNKEYLKRIHKMGGRIGLHYHRGDKDDLQEIKEEIVLQARMLGEMLDIPIDRFSFHRPLREHLAADMKIDGLINAYGHEFFSYSEKPEENPDVKYISDSNHEWKYGNPGNETFQEYDRIQLLVHPLSWSKEGAEHVENFQMLVQEKHDEFVDTIEREWKTFDQLRGKL